MLRTKRMDDWIHRINGVEGWLYELEPIALIHLPLTVDHLPGDIVEIGSYRGKSTLALGIGSVILSRSKRPVYAIDPFIPDHGMYVDDYYSIFWDNILNAGLEDHVIPIRKYSTEAYEDCPASIALLFIDGDHSYSGVMHDIVHYTPKVVSGGIIAFHDYGLCEGVVQAVKELLQNPGFEHVCDYTYLRVLRKL